MHDPLLVAEHLLDIGRPDAAEQALQEHPHPEEPVWWEMLARAANDANRPADAAHAAERGLSMYPEAVPLHALLASARADLGELALAETSLLAALSRAPEEPHLLAAYARVCARDGQFAKAHALLDLAIHRDPEDPVVMVSQYVVAHLEGDDPRARQLAATVAAATGGTPAALMLLRAEALKELDLHAAEALQRAAIRGDLSMADGQEEALREVRVSAHPLMWPVIMTARIGPIQLWLAALVAVEVSRRVAPAEVTLGIAVAWLVLVAYTWLAPVVLRRVL